METLSHDGLNMLLAVTWNARIDKTCFSAHSTRFAFTSAAAATNLSDIIMNSAGWANETTFSRFFKKRIEQAEQPHFEEHLLSSQIMKK